jgi:4a-hydroxytetrahydrobiopterin dehydratase
MSEQLTRQEASDATVDLGWRYVLGLLRTHVAVDSLDRALEVAARAGAAAKGVEGDGGGEHLAIDVRRDRLVLSLQTPATASVTSRDVDIAGAVSAAIAELGLRTDPSVGDRAGRSVQVIEIAIDAMDIPAIRPFWKAVTGYVDEADRTGPEDPLVDPAGQGPAIWFQQMDRPRPQRNRIHLDISVPHDEARARLEGALAAGGRLVSDTRAPAFWVLADAEGNEACITTWQGRD